MNWVRMSVFDLDRTLVQGNSSFDFCHYLIAQGVLPKSTLIHAICYYLRHTYFGLPVQALHEKVFERVLRGLSLTELESHASLFVADYLEKRINPFVFSALRLAQHLGEYTIILSNSPQFLVNVFAEKLKVDEWHSTHYAVDADNRLSSISHILQGEEKAAYLHQTMERLRIAKNAVTAYSDSYLDLPLLMASGTPVAVNPDRKLHRVSLENQWTLR